MLILGEKALLVGFVQNWFIEENIIVEMYLNLDEKHLHIYYITLRKHRL